MTMSNDIKPGEQLTLAQINRLRARPQAPAASGNGGGNPDWNVASDELRKDGPTAAEFVAAGYPASNYPPFGYASRSSEEEIAAAVAAQAGPGSGSAETDPLKMTVPDLKAWLTAKGIEFDASAKKDDLQALVPKE
jgi:hypothetical protein